MSQMRSLVVKTESKVVSRIVSKMAVTCNLTFIRSQQVVRKIISAGCFFLKCWTNARCSIYSCHWFDKVIPLSSGHGRQFSFLDFYKSGICVFLLLLIVTWISNPRHIWAAALQNQRNDRAPSEDSDQPGHPPSLIGLIGVFAVRSMGSYGPKFSSCGQRRLWSDWADAQADLSLRWAHMPFCWFCHEAAHLKTGFGRFHFCGIIIKSGQTIAYKADF